MAGDRSRMYAVDGVSENAALQRAELTTIDGELEAPSGISLLCIRKKGVIMIKFIRHAGSTVQYNTRHCCIYKEVKNYTFASNLANY